MYIGVFDYRSKAAFPKLLVSGVSFLIPPTWQEMVVHTDIISLTFNVSSARNYRWSSSEISLEEALLNGV